MTGTDESLSAARLTDLVKRTLMVMFGRRPVSGTYTLDCLLYTSDAADD